ncbi:MAG: hypothetical protein ACLFQ8_03400 [Candidatus Aenigmatarchaeota archaeon]
MPDHPRESNSAISSEKISSYDPVLEEAIQNELLEGYEKDQLPEKIDLQYWDDVSNEIVDFVEETGYGEKALEILLYDGMRALKKGNSVSIKIKEHEAYIPSRDEYYGNGKDHEIYLEII